MSWAPLQSNIPDLPLPPPVPVSMYRGRRVQNLEQGSWSLLYSLAVLVSLRQVSSQIFSVLYRFQNFAMSPTELEEFAQGHSRCLACWPCHPAALP